MKNIFNLMKETPEERETRQAKDKPIATNKANSVINNAIKGANNADDDKKGNDKKVVPG